MRSFPPKIAGRSCVPRRFATRSMPTSKRLKGPDALVRNTVELPTCSFSENHPRGGVADAFRARRLMSLYPGLKHPTSQSLRRGWLFGVTYHNMRGAIASATAAWANLSSRCAAIHASTSGLTLVPRRKCPNTRVLSEIGSYRRPLPHRRPERLWTQEISRVLWLLRDWWWRVGGTGRVASPRRPALRRGSKFKATKTDGPLGDRTLPPPHRSKDDSQISGFWFTSRLS